MCSHTRTHTYICSDIFFLSIQSQTYLLLNERCRSQFAAEYSLLSQRSLIEFNELKVVFESHLLIIQMSRVLEMCEQKKLEKSHFVRLQSNLTCSKSMKVEERKRFQIKRDAFKVFLFSPLIFPSIFSSFLYWYDKDSSKMEGSFCHFRNY